MEDTVNRPTTQFGGAKLIIGIFFVIHGLLLTADNLGAFDAWRILRYWPAAIVLVGLYKIWQPGRQLGGVILIVGGGALLAHNAGWLHMSLFSLWPLLLIVAGLAIIARATGVDVAQGSERNVVAVLTSRKIVPRQFDGASIIAFMGGCQLDLTDAEMAQKSATVEVFAMWGGVEIFVPETWDVVGEVVPVMAGFEVKVAPKGTPQHQLIVRGNVLMAGVEIKRRES